METFRKIFNALMVLCFLLSAALQYNDPDPYIWVPIYLAGAWVCYKAYKGQFDGRWYAICSISYLLYAGYLFFTSEGVLSWFSEHHRDSLVQTMKASKPWIEQTREFGGLLILLFALAVNWLLLRKNSLAK